MARTEGQLRAQAELSAGNIPRQGVPSCVRVRAINNAKRATELREVFLETLHSRIATIRAVAEREGVGSAEEIQLLVDQRIMQLLSADVNRLMTDSENRGLGAPRVAIELDDVRGRALEDMTDEELAAIATSDPDAEFPQLEGDSGDETAGSR